MTHCEKCIYYDKCKADMDVAPDDTFSFFPYNEDCPHFKNKADFVEVVRCKDCERAIGQHALVPEKLCLIHRCSVPENYYCANGKRKDE